MTKKSFPIPEGCKAVTVEQVGNQIITTFEPVFKRGDVLICYDKTISADTGLFIFIFIFKDLVPDNMGNGMCSYVHLSLNRLRLYYEDRLASNWDVLRHATPEEAQLLWDALAKKGKRWNPETMQVEKIKKERWRAKEYEVYYCPIDFEGANCQTQDNKSIIDDYMFDNGFYCQTPDQSERLFKVIKQATDKFWEEELR